MRCSSFSVKYRPAEIRPCAPTNSSTFSPSSPQISHPWLPWQSRALSRFCSNSMLRRLKIPFTKSPRSSHIGIGEHRQRPGSRLSLQFICHGSSPLPQLAGRSNCSMLRCIVACNHCRFHKTLQPHVWFLECRQLRRLLSKSVSSLCRPASVPTMIVVILIVSCSLCRVDYPF